MGRGAVARSFERTTCISVEGNLSTLLSVPTKFKLFIGVTRREFDEILDGTESISVALLGTKG